MSDIFTLCENGDEEGVRKMIAADRAVVHARDTFVSCLSPNIACRIYILSTMTILISSHISIIYSAIGLLCSMLQRMVMQPLCSSFYKQGLIKMLRVG